MISSLSYVPRRGVLGSAGAGAASAFLGALVVIAFAFSSPIVLAADALAVCLVGLAAGAGRALALAAKWSAAIALLTLVTNAIASQRGATILVRGPEVPLLGALDVTAEALAEGGILALRVAIAICAFLIHTSCVDPDRVLRLLRPLARRSALTATLILRLAPVVAADYGRIAEAAALRGPAARPVTRGALARRLVAGSLDRAVDVAATLELRGYARGAPGRPRRRPGQARATRMWAATAGLAALALAGLGAGAGGWEAYPHIRMDTGAGTLALAAAVPALALLPFARRRDRA